MLKKTRLIRLYNKKTIKNNIIKKENNKYIT